MTATIVRLNRGGRGNVLTAVILAVLLGRALAHGYAYLAALDTALVALNLFCWFMCTHAEARERALS